MLRNLERAACTATAGRSASASTRNGSEPPSSSTLFFTARPAAAATCEPARSLPVIVTAAIRGSASRRAVVSPTVPSSTSRVRNSPLGKPASPSTASNANAQPDTLGACLSSPPLPAMRAGAANRVTCQKGKFQGMIARTTPSGS